MNLWVDKESGALLQAEAYDWQGKLIKRFEVISGQKLEGKWYLKQMRIESARPRHRHDVADVSGDQGLGEVDPPGPES